MARLLFLRLRPVGRGGVRVREPCALLSQHSRQPEIRCICAVKGSEWGTRSIHHSRKYQTSACLHPHEYVSPTCFLTPKNTSKLTVN